MTPSTMATAARSAASISKTRGVQQVGIGAPGRSRHGGWRGRARPALLSGDRARSGQPPGPRASNWRARRSMRALLSASMNSFTSASGQITVPMSRPSSTAPPGCVREIALELAAAPARTVGDHRHLAGQDAGLGAGQCSDIGRDAPASSACAAAMARASNSGVPLASRHGAARRRGRAGRYRDAAGRSGAPGPRPACPCPRRPVHPRQ